MRRPGAATRVVAALVVTWAVAGCGAVDGGATAGGPIGAASVDPAGGAPPGPSAAAIAATGLNPCPSSDATAQTLSEGLPDQGLPNLTLPCLGKGPDVRLTGLRGKPLVLNIWASWCGPCRDEMPTLAAVASAAGDRVAFLGVDIQESQPESALDLLRASGVRYPSVVDWDKQTQASLRYTGPPMTVFVRADGTIAARVAGPVGDAAALRSLIRTNLGVEVAA